MPESERIDAAEQVSDSTPTQREDDDDREDIECVGR
jgi:hypothetical protein